MLENLKNRLIRGWTLMRIVRLALALIIIVQAASSSEMLFVAFGAFLLFQAAFNYGCCGVSGCDINHKTHKSKSGSGEDEIITFNEVK